jgi:lysophospholipase L1-like esterase
MKLGDVLLFQGDSITDAGRDRAETAPNNITGLGCGYVNQVVGELMHKDAPIGLTVYNRGCSGHRVYQLSDRWEEDCLVLEPDTLSILIGVNDFTHRHVYQNGYGGTLEDYSRDYVALLDRTLERLPAVRFVLGEPFLIEAGAITAEHVDAIGAYQGAARKVADKYKAVWVPFQRAFNHALEIAPASYWAPDGIHPTPAGHRLMAETWMHAVQAC